MCQTETGLTIDVSLGIVSGYILGGRVNEEEREMMRNNLPEGEPGGIVSLTFPNKVGVSIESPKTA